MEIHCAPIGLSSSTLSTLSKRWKKNVSATQFKVLLCSRSHLRSQTDAYENIFPALNEALKLCMSKSPADLRNENGGCLKPTLRKNLIDDCLSWSTPFQLNAHRFVQRVRRARGDLVENFDSGLTWAQIIERARNHLAIMANANENCYINL